MSVTAAVTANEDGWRVSLAGQDATPPLLRHRAAVTTARQIVQRAGGGEVVVHTRSGRAAERLTVPSSRSDAALH